MNEIQVLSEACFENGEGLFDTYEKQKITLGRLSQYVAQTLKALNEIVVAHSEQYSPHELISGSVSGGPVDLNQATDNYKIYSDLRVDLQNMIAVLRSYLLDDTNSIDTINQRVISFQSSIELFFAHIADEIYTANNFQSQVEIIKSNYLQIGGDILNLIRLRDSLNDRCRSH